MLAYTRPLSCFINIVTATEDWNSFTYYATDTVVAEEDSNATAYAATYWRPQERTATQISVGYDVISFDGQSNGKVEEAASYFVGLGWPDMFQDNDYIGIGLGQPLKSTKTVGGGAARCCSRATFMGINLFI